MIGVPQKRSCERDLPDRRHVAVAHVTAPTSSSETAPRQHEHAEQDRDEHEPPQRDLDAVDEREARRRRAARARGSRRRSSRRRPGSQPAETPPCGAGSPAGRGSAGPRRSHRRRSSTARAPPAASRRSGGTSPPKRKISREDHVEHPEEHQRPEQRPEVAEHRAEVAQLELGCGQCRGDVGEVLPPGEGSRTRNRPVRTATGVSSPGCARPRGSSRAGRRNRGGDRQRPSCTAPPG